MYDPLFDHSPSTSESELWEPERLLLPSCEQTGLTSNPKIDGIRSARPAASLRDRRRQSRDAITVIMAARPSVMVAFGEKCRGPIAARKCALPGLRVTSVTAARQSLDQHGSASPVAGASLLVAATQAL